MILKQLDPSPLRATGLIVNYNLVPGVLELIFFAGTGSVYLSGRGGGKKENIVRHDVMS